MKLIFLSNQSDPETDPASGALASLLETGKSPTVTYVPSQADTDRRYHSLAKAYYQGIGMERVDHFDLDARYDETGIGALMESGAIHLSGGSTYHFLRNMQRRNFFSVLRRYVAEGGILIGVSAGAILMTPDITSSTLCGDPVIEGLATEGLGLVDWEFVPHVDSIPGIEGKLIGRSKISPRRILACGDGGGILIANGEIRRVGEIREYQSGARC